MCTNPFAKETGVTEGSLEVPRGASREPRSCSMQVRYDRLDHTMST